MPIFVYFIASDGTSPGRWVYIRAQDSQAAMLEASRLGLPAGNIQGQLDPSASDYIGNAQREFLNSNPDRVTDRTSESGPRSGGKDLNSPLSGGDDVNQDFGLDDGIALERGDIEAAFRRSLNRQGISQLGRPRNLAERIAQGRAGAGVAAFSAADRLRALTDPESRVGLSDTPAEDFFDQNFGKFGQSAARSFSGLATLAKNRFVNERGNDPGLLSLVNPTTDEDARIVFDAAREAFLSRFSPIASGSLARGDSVQSALADFRAGTGSAGIGNFFESLRKRFALGAA